MGRREAPRPMLKGEGLEEKRDVSGTELPAAAPYQVFCAAEIKDVNASPGAPITAERVASVWTEFFSEKGEK